LFYVLSFKLSKGC